MKKLADSDNCKKVLHELICWIEKTQSDQTNTVLISINGHRFVFPLLTKELRRSKTKITFPIVLWDASLILGQKSLTDGDGFVKLMDLEKQFEQHTSFQLQVRRESFEI
jgi:hypothetical protein